MCTPSVRNASHAYHNQPSPFTVTAPNRNHYSCSCTTNNICQENCSFKGQEAAETEVHVAQITTRVAAGSHACRHQTESRTSLTDVASRDRLDRYTSSADICRRCATLNRTEHTPETRSCTVNRGPWWSRRPRHDEGPCQTLPSMPGRCRLHCLKLPMALSLGTVEELKPSCHTSVLCR